MTLQEVKNLIFNSTRDDWKPYSGEGIFALTFVHNISIQLRRNEEDELKSFIEPWANGFTDTNAYRDLYVLYFNSNPIEKYLFVSVDGGRASLPIPKSRTDLVVTREMYNLGKIINDDEKNYEDYFKDAGLSIE